MSLISCGVFVVAAMAEVRNPPGAPRVPLLPGLGDGSGRNGLVSDVGHQSV